MRMRFRMDVFFEIEDVYSPWTPYVILIIIVWYA